MTETRLNILTENDNSTVLTEYIPPKKIDRSYQSEADLELEFIKTLTEVGYEYLDIHDSKDLVSNLRKQLEKLNNYKFTDNEWRNIYNNYLANGNDGIIEKTTKVQRDFIYPMTLDSGELKNIYIIKKDNIFNNSLQVINQYVNNDGNHDNRYDVTILVNGLPLVHVELKRRGVDIREAFNQINRYQRDSFWAGTGLYNFIQIFVISNGTYTKYYSNTTRESHINNSKVKKSNSFEFTSYWADQKNNAITDLMDFAKTFFTKRTLLNILTKYCIFTSENDLMVMRPYQIVATEKILNKILIAHENKFVGSIKAGGYVWHTTGSGKTLTSFKTAQLATNLDFIDKVLFVVDRKDLDYQTMKEYDRFEKDSANSSSNSNVLKRQLEDKDKNGVHHKYKIIITTIQKLDSFIKKNPYHEAYNKQIVFIFDECHRSQFGDMHKNIIKHFKNYYIFGFTGTPIFPQNARTSKGIQQTTEQIFGDRLHTYTIVNAINDKNVLPFRYEYVGKVDIRDNVKDEKIYAIDEEKAYDSDARISKIVDYIIDNYSIKTKTNESYVMKTLDNVHEVAKNQNTEEVRTKKNINGFNSILAVSSIPMAKKYYECFKKHIESNLKVALIYSYGVNDEDNNGMIDENNESTDKLSKSDRDFLDYAIDDYNKMFGMHYSTESQEFQNYYKDVSLRMKNREIDILIVVNMFLTGFDAKTLNTLWVDKNLKYHGLIQAFSRTNRILNSVKTFGNIVSFRNLENDLNDALALFGDNDARGIVLLKPYDDYYHGYQDGNKSFKGYEELVKELTTKFPLGETIQGEDRQKEFIKLYGAILKVTNILSSFDQFKSEQLLEPRDMQDYHSTYIDLYNEFRNKAKRDKTDITDDVVFEMELIKQIEVNIDYILALVKKYHDSHMQDKDVLVTINKAIMSSPDLRNKKDLIEEFIESLNESSDDIYNDFEMFMNSKKKIELDEIIKEENLNPEETYKFVEKAFENGNVEEDGTDVSKILPPMNMFTPDHDRQKKKNKVLDKLIEFFDKFFSITNNKF